MLALVGQLESRRVERVDKGTQARDVDLVLDRARDRHKYVDEEAGQRVLDVLVLDVDEVLSAVVEKVERGFELIKLVSDVEC